MRSFTSYINREAWKQDFLSVFCSIFISTPSKMEMSSENMSMDQIWDIVWRTFKNASLTYDLAFSQNGTKTGPPDDGNFFDNPAKLGIFTGLIIAWLADIQIGPIQDSRMLDVKMKAMITWTFNIIFFSIFAPFVAIFLTGCFLYRQTIALLLQKSEGNDFGGLLEGTDCVWALEDHHAYSIINVLAFLEMTSTPDPSNILNDLRKLIQDRLISQNFEKLCWLRDEKLGYSYWRRTDGIIDLDERIRWLDHEECDGTCGDVYNGYLRKLINKICNQPLPDDHKTNWEILVGRNCQKSLNGSQKIINIPLVFRIHHTVGDGVALLRLLLEAIADSQFNVVIDKNPEINTEFYDLNISNNGISSKSFGHIIHYSEDLLDASMPFAIRSVPPIAENLTKIFFNLRERISSIIRDFGKNLVVLISIPSCLVRQVVNSFDNSSLHGAPLTGEKIISCWMECDFVDDTEDSGLLAKIRDIKNSTGTRFGDVVLAAISSNLHHYFEKRGEVVPKTVTVVIPARMSAPSRELSLKNRFSVGLLPLCISEVDGKALTSIVNENEESRCKRLLERLWDVSKCSEDLRQKSDYLINYWVMTWLSAALPKILLEPFLKSYSSMIFSNLPGPSEIRILGNCLKKVAFFIPHRGTTGIGLSFLTYGKRAHLSLIVDKGIIREERILDEIIRGTIDDIQNLYEYIINLKLTHLRKQGSVCCNE